MISHNFIAMHTLITYFFLSFLQKIMATVIFIATSRITRTSMISERLSERERIHVT